MHIEILVEDLSGKKALDILLEKLAGTETTFRVHPYKGMGHIPDNMRDANDPSKRILLTNLPKLLKGYGRTFQAYEPNYKAAVLVVCDLDRKNREHFLAELQNILASCHPQPVTRFCVAVEEGEAWLLGDIPAILSAYPNANRDVLNSYVNDSICGTWEVLADAVYQGGAKALSNKGWQAIGAEKTRWAEEITPRMDVETNASPSFRYFTHQVRSLIEG